MKPGRGADLKALLAGPGSPIRVALIFGEDSGLVHERAKAAVTWVAGSSNDPFRVTELPAAMIKADPARLDDEVRARSMIGGRRVVWVREAADALIGDAIERLIGDLAADKGADTLVVLEAGDLQSRSSLRKLAEGSPIAAAIPCYHDGAADLARVVDETLAAHRLTIAPDTRAYLVDRLGNDRLISRGELEKLTLLVPSGGEVTRAHVADSTGDSSDMSIGDVVSAVAGGLRPELGRALDRVWADGESPVAVVRAVTRHFQRLHAAAAGIAKGQSPEAAIGALRPPPFKRDAEEMGRQLRVWALDRLTATLAELTRAEVSCKSTGLPDQTMLAQALFTIVTRARPPSRL